jgi:flagellar biosynthetic protein FliR
MLLNGIDVFLLVFVRMTGLFVIAPVFGRKNIPTYFKIGFSFMMALILVNTIKVPQPDYYNNVYQYAFLIIKEFIVGLTLGYVSYMIFTAIYIAGQMIDMQIGFSLVSVLDPMSNIQIPITSNFYFIISMLVFMSVNGHHVLIKALFDSYKSVPVGAAVFSSDLMNDIIRVFGGTFVIAFKIAAPITAAVLISDVAMGVISRTIPQLNVFVVGMPLKIALGLITMLLTIPMFIALLGSLFEGTNGEMLKFLKDLGLGNVQLP